MPRTNSAQRPEQGCHLRRLAAVIIVVVVAASAAASLVGKAAATAEPVEAVDQSVLMYASDYSVSQEEATRRLNRIQPIQQILAKIRSLEQTRIAGWGIDHQGALMGWVWLTGDAAPSTAATQIAEGHTDVEIRTNAHHTYAQLLEAQRSFGTGVGAAGQVNDSPGYGTTISQMVTFTDIDMAANAMSIGIDPALAVGTGEPGAIGPVAVSDEALRSKAIVVASLLRDHIEVAFAVVDGRNISHLATFVGGGAMSSCTSGFSAKTTDSDDYGIITAGHCADIQSMYGIALPFDYGWESREADAQFHRIPTGSSHTLLDDYICNPWISTQCDVTDDVDRSMMSGDFVCHAGRTTGHSCGTVNSINAWPLVPGFCKQSSNGPAVVCGRVFVKVEGPSLKACEGDSGGPLYRNGIAYGIIMAGSDPQDCSSVGKTVLYSAIREVQDFLDVEILTEGSVTVN